MFKEIKKFRFSILSATILVVCAPAFLHDTPHLVAACLGCFGLGALVVHELADALGEDDD